VSDSEHAVDSAEAGLPHGSEGGLCGHRMFGCRGCGYIFCNREAGHGGVHSHDFPEQVVRPARNEDVCHEPIERLAGERITSSVILTPDPEEPNEYCSWRIQITTESGRLIEISGYHDSLPEVHEEL